MILVLLTAGYAAYVLYDANGALKRISSGEPAASENLCAAAPRRCC